MRLILAAAEWSREETDLLWRLCGQFGLRFLVVHDRFVQSLQTLPTETHTVEEMKERYFDVVRKLQTVRGLSSAQFVYDAELDRRRRMVLESYHARSVEQSIEETFVVDYLAQLQQGGELQSRLAERIEIIKLLAGEQFTAGWPTLPELLKIAAGKGSRFLSKPSKKKTVASHSKRDRAAHAGTESADSSTSSIASMTASPGQKRPAPKPSSGDKKLPTSKTTLPAVKKSKTSGTSAPCNIYLRSSRLQQLRAGSARAVEKMLADYNLPLRPDLPTAAVMAKFDQVRAAIAQLIEARRGAGGPPSGANSSVVGRPFE